MLAVEKAWVQGEKRHEKIKHLPSCKVLGFFRDAQWVMTGLCQLTVADVGPTQQPDLWNAQWWIPIWHRPIKYDGLNSAVQIHLSSSPQFDHYLQMSLRFASGSGQM